MDPVDIRTIATVKPPQGLYRVKITTALKGEDYVITMGTDNTILMLSTPDREVTPAMDDLRALRMLLRDENNDELNPWHAVYVESKDGLTTYDYDYTGDFLADVQQYGLNHLLTVVIPLAIYEQVNPCR